MSENNQLNDPNRLITLAIHSYGEAVRVQALLEQAGIEVVLHNVNLSEPLVSTGVRVRIAERDLPVALRIVENPSIILDSTNSVKNSVVLVPVDFSSYSLKACKVGFEYASLMGCRVLIMHAYMNEGRRFFLPFSSDRFDDKMSVDDSTVKAQAMLSMRQFEATLRQHILDGVLAKVTFETELREGIPEECILQSASEHEAQLVVMGTHGRTGKGRVALGSVAAEVVDAGKIPVFTVPKNMSTASLSAIRNVVFFSNLIPQDILSFDQFTHLMQLNNVTVNIIPVVDPKDKSWAVQSGSQLLQYCREHYPLTKFNYVDLKFDEHLDAFQQFVDSHHIDLIAIPNKKKNIFSRLFNPSIAHRVLFQSDLPMLVVPV